MSPAKNQFIFLYPKRTASPFESWFGVRLETLTALTDPDPHHFVQED